MGAFLGLDRACSMGFVAVGLLGVVDLSTGGEPVKGVRFLVSGWVAMQLRQAGEGTHVGIGFNTASTLG